MLNRTSRTLKPSQEMPMSDQPAEFDDDDVPAEYPESPDAPESG